MKIELLCNAGLALTYESMTLLVDVPNGVSPPFFALPETDWLKILNREQSWGSVCGLFFTHDHPDHYHRQRVEEYQRRWPDIPVFIPDEETEKAVLVMGPFVITCARFPHAPMEEGTPPHVLTWIRAGDETVYLAADAKMDVEGHGAFLKGRKANAAFWNAMYLSQPLTRNLIRSAAEKSYIYHMPSEKPDSCGIWRKCQRNLQRYGQELESVTVLDGVRQEIV